MTERSPEFLAHRDGDDVAVAVRDLQPGTVMGGFLGRPGSVSVELVDAVPLGHKLALSDTEPGGDVIEYGVRVAVASQRIGKGEYVHTHNVRSARWQNSVA